MRCHDLAFVVITKIFHVSPTFRGDCWDFSRFRRRISIMFGICLCSRFAISLLTTITPRSFIYNVRCPLIPKGSTSVKLFLFLYSLDVDLITILIFNWCKIVINQLTITFLVLHSFYPLQIFVIDDWNWNETILLIFSLTIKTC